jgi:DNA-binding NarL/FixJ family response regulator
MVLSVGGSVLRRRVSPIRPTLHDSSMFVRAGFDAGALGYVLMMRMDEELTQAIREVHLGNHFISRGALLH